MFSNMSRLNAAWVPVIRAILRCLKDLQGQLSDSATFAIVKTEAAKLMFAAQEKNTPQAKLARLQEVAQYSELEFYADMRSGSFHKYKRHAGIVLLKTFLSRGVSRQGSLSFLPKTPIELGCAETAGNLHVCLTAHKTQKSYGAMLHQYSPEMKVLFGWYLQQTRPRLLEDPKVTWEHPDMIFPSEKSVISLMAHFWRTSPLKAQASRMSFSQARHLMCRDVQSCLNHPIFGSDVKELQNAAGHGISSSQRLIEEHYSLSKLGREAVLANFVSKRYSAPVRAKMCKHLSIAGFAVPKPGELKSLAQPTEAKPAPMKKRRGRPKRKAPGTRLCANKLKRKRCLSLGAPSFTADTDLHCTACQTGFGGRGIYSKKRAKLYDESV